jgi:16S rRNA (guanine966-N2)-methyltransferase
MSLKITGGQWRGRVLPCIPHSAKLRPTTAKVREGMMSRLQPWLQGARVFDLYAGTGLLGLEALSRGAASLVAVEHHPAQCRHLRHTLAQFGVGQAQAIVVCQRVEAWLAGLDMGTWLHAPSPEVRLLVFLDPPYHYPALPEIVRVVLTRFPQENTCIVVEQAADEPVLPLDDLGIAPSRRTYGDTAVSIIFPQEK